MEVLMAFLLFQEKKNRNLFAYGSRWIILTTWVFLFFFFFFFFFRFCLFQVEDSLELYKAKYDIVIVQDESLDVANAIIDKILCVAG